MWMFNQTKGRENDAGSKERDPWEVSEWSCLANGSKKKREKEGKK